MVYLNIGEFTPQLLDYIIDTLNRLTVKGKTPLKINLDSPGGDVGLKSALVDLLGGYCCTINLISAKSSAFDFLFDLENAKINVFNTSYAMYHKAKPTEISKHKEKETALNEMVYLETKSTNEVLDKLDLEYNEIKRFHKGEDIYIGPIKLKQIFKERLS